MIRSPWPHKKVRLDTLVNAINSAQKRLADDKNHAGSMALNALGVALIEEWEKE